MWPNRAAAGQARLSRATKIRGAMKVRGSSECSTRARHRLHTLGGVPHGDARGLIPHEDALGLVPHEDALGLVPHEDALGLGYGAGRC